MAEMTNFEFLGSNKNVTKVEVSIDGGLTYGILFSKQEAVEYRLVPTMAIEDYTNMWIYEHDASNEDYDFSINVEWTLFADNIIVTTGTATFGPFGRPATGDTISRTEQLSIEYNGKTYTTNIQFIITNSSSDVDTSATLTVYSSDGSSATATYENSAVLYVGSIYSNGNQYVHSFHGTYDYISNNETVYDQYWSCSTETSMFPDGGSAYDVTIGEVSVNGLTVYITADLHDM